MKRNCNYDETISSKEILRLILEEKITIWDLSIKLNVNLSGSNLIKEMLLKCCNNDTEKANRYLEIIKDNNTKYIETNTFETICFKTLVSLVDSGYTHIELMKKFGIAGYSTFSYHLKKIFKNEKISNSLKETLINKIRENRHSKRVKIIYEENVENLAENNVEPKQDIDVTKGVPTTELTSLPIEVVNTNENFNSDKIIIYSYGYLKFVNLDKEFLDYNEEKIILSLSFELFMKDNQIMDSKKAMLSSAINDPKINLRILATSTWYNRKDHTKNLNISSDNDILISQALMLSRYTNKDIYIAALENFTVLNILTMGFGVRVSKQMLIEGFFNFNSKEDTLSYFNYKLPKENSINISEDSKVYVLDTCFIIGDTNSKDDSLYKDKAREYFFKNKKDLKLICKSVLLELKLQQHFFSTIYAAKCNPTIKLILDMNVNYNFEDVAILNYAMHCQNKIGNNVILLTHDYSMFMEALQYNLSTIFFQEDFENIIKMINDDESNKIAIESFNEEIDEESEDENFNGLISKPLYKTILFTDYGEKHILINSNDLDKVIDHNSMVMRKIEGHNSFKFYIVEIGDFIMFKDSSIYKIDSFEGDDNLTFVKQKDYWKKYGKSKK